MKKLYKAALLAALGLTSVTAAQAQSAATDVFIGFNNAGSTNSAANNDYVVDLGAAAQFTTTATLNLSSSFNATTFATAFGADLAGSSYGNYNNVAVGAVHGATGISVFTTALSPNTPNGGDFANLIAAAQAGVAGALGTGSQLIASGSGNWGTYISTSPNANAGTFAGLDNANPMQYLSSGTITEILWQSTQTGGGRFPTYSAFTELGTLAIDVNTGSVIFTGVAAVPEPSTYALFGGAGLMLLAFRNKFRRVQV